MTKTERQKLIDLLTESHTINEMSSLPYTHPTKAFNRGYAWGIEMAMDAVGFTQAERWEIWSAVKDDCYRRRHEQAAERDRASWTVS